MKTLSIVATVIVWTAVGVAAWAVWPMAVKVLGLAQQFHNLWL